MVGSYQVVEQRQQLLLLLHFHEPQALPLVECSREHVHEDESDEDC
jgi:hypothetical protein